MQVARYVVGRAPLITEFVNRATAHWWGGSEVRPVAGPQLLEALVGMVSEGNADALRRDPRAARRLTQLARDLRCALLAETPSAQAEHINTMIRRYRAQPVLVEDVGQPFHLHFQAARGTGLDGLAGEFAVALALIVDGYGGRRFGQCQARRCDAVYIDLTRNGSRRFCSTACTARAKTAAYRARQPG